MYTFYMTKKSLFLWVLIWSLILMILLSAPRSIDRTNYWQARYYVMGISWLIGMVIMTRQVMLGIRPMFNWFTKDFFWINGLHKRLGIGTLMSLIFHPIASVISYGTSRLYIISLDFSDAIEWWISVGKISFDLILIVLITSILSRKILSYRKRHRIHLLSYPAFIWVWFHALFTGTMIAEIPAIRWYWFGIGWVLMIAMILRLAYQYGFLKIKSQIISHTKKTSDIYELELALPRSVSYSEWQFMYLQDKAWWESHPFTVLAYNDSSRRMTITYKVYGSFTQQLAQLTAWETLYLDGPYGVFMEEVEQTQQPIVCIAAGIWITPFYQIIQNYSTTKDIQLLYLNKTKDDMVYAQELESQLATDSCTHILSREKTSDNKNQIVDTRITKDILKTTVWEKLLTAQYYICGWWAVINEITLMLNQLWVQSKNIDFEPFTM